MEGKKEAPPFIDLTQDSSSEEDELNPDFKSLRQRHTPILRYPYRKPKEQRKLCILERNNYPCFFLNDKEMSLEGKASHYSRYFHSKK